MRVQLAHVLPFHSSATSAEVLEEKHGKRPQKARNSTTDRTSRVREKGDTAAALGEPNDHVDHPFSSAASTSQSTSQLQNCEVLHW